MQDPGSGFDTPLHNVVVNGDGTLNFDNYGQSASASDYSLRFINFQRSNHNGSYTDKTGNTSNYSAYKQ